MSGLPSSWESRPIGEVTQIVAGGTPPSKEPANFQEIGGIAWLTPADLSGYRDMYISRGTRNLSETGYKASSAKKMPAGTVLFSSRAPIGYVAIAKNDISTNQGFKSFVLPDVLESRFVYYQLRHITPIAESIATGTTFKELSGAAAAKLPISIAPIPEQKRIADKLDTVLARVDASRERLDRVALILGNFKKSVLVAATSGELTEHWRNERAESTRERTFSTGFFDKAWTESKLSDLCQRGRVITYGVIKLGEEVSDGVPCLRTSNVRWLQIDTKKIKKISLDLSNEYARTVLSGNEVLVNVRGTLGGVATVTREMIGWNVSREVAVVPVDLEKINADYLKIWLASDTSQRWLSKVERGVAYVGINIEDLRCLPVKVPLREEQHEIVRRVEMLFAFADRLETRLATARTAADRLTPALLAKAFRGELVPQDPNDEPAGVLLQRLAAAQTEGRVKSKRTKKPTSQLIANRGAIP